LQALHGRCDTKRVLQGLLTPSSNTALEQFDEATILEASRLVADARVDVIAWNGTSSGWLGFEADVALCRCIEQETGVRCCTSVLALNEIMEKAAANVSAWSRPVSTTCTRPSSPTARAAASTAWPNGTSGTA
jgi:hypothetical protein